MSTTRHRFSLASATAVLALLGTSGCGPDDVGTAREAVPSTGVVPGASPEPAPSASGRDRFDPLSLSLEFATTTVEAGAELPTRALLENDSTEVVVDPACMIAEGRYALVPIDQPEEELWVRPMTDCGGPHRMPPGYREEFDGPLFFARTAGGEPLPPGEYLAVLDIRGLSQRLEYRVTVTP